MTRSLLFAPANRSDLIRKLPRADADNVVVDLEDGTPPAEKEAARAALADNVACLRSSGMRGRVLVRVNQPASEHYRPDLERAVELAVDGIVIPKLEKAAELGPAVDAIERGRGGPSPTILAGIESIRGVVDVFQLLCATPHLTELYFGGEDFVADMGGRRTADAQELLYARSRVVLAAKANDKVAFDQGIAAIRDDALFLRDANFGRDLGYDGKICVLPRQVALCREVFTPGAAEMDHARRLVAAYEEAQRQGIGTIDFEGQMIDGPLLKRARRTLEIGGRFGGDAAR